jgi:hypothetical protein
MKTAAPKLTPEIAFEAYEAQTQRPRSIQSLERTLKADGYKTSRETLTRWSNENKWEKTLGNEEALTTVEYSGPALQAIVERVKSAGITEALDHAIQDLFVLAECMTKRATAAIGHVSPENVSDALSMAKGAIELVKALAELRNTMNGIATTAEDSGLLIEGTVEKPGLKKLLEDMNKRMGVAVTIEG